MSLPKDNPFKNEPQIARDIKRIMEGWVEGNAEDFLKENTISEGGVKGAIEDFMYDTLPQAAVKELQPVFKNKSIRGSQLRDKVSIILKKHKIPTFFMGTSATQVVIDNFETYFGESVEEAYAHPDEKILGRFYEKTGKQAFEYRISQDSWGKSHGYPHEVCVSRKDYKSKGDWRAANVKATVCYIATDEGEGGKPVVEKWDITKHIKYVKVEGVEENGEVLNEAAAMIPFKRILKGVNDMEGPFLIVVMRKGGPGALIQKKVPGRAALPAHINHMLSSELQKYEWKAIAIENANGKIVNLLYPTDVLTKAGSKPSFKEEIELDEDNWGGGFQSSADAHREVQAGLKADFQRERAQKLKLIVQVIRGEISKQKFKKLTGSNYDELMKNSPYFRNQVKRMPKKALEPVAKKEEVERIAEATPDQKAKQAAIDARVRKMNTDDAVEQVKEILRSYGNDKTQRQMIIAAIKNIKEQVEVNELTNLRTYNNAYPNTMIASSKEMDEEFKAGDTVKVPHKGKIVKGKIVRFDNGGTSKAQQHGGGYVVDVGEPASILVPKHNVRKN